MDDLQQELLFASIKEILELKVFLEGSQNSPFCSGIGTALSVLEAYGLLMPGVYEGVFPFSEE